MKQSNNHSDNMEIDESLNQLNNPILTGPIEPSVSHSSYKSQQQWIYQSNNPSNQYITHSTQSYSQTNNPTNHQPIRRSNNQPINLSMDGFVAQRVNRLDVSDIDGARPRPINQLIKQTIKHSISPSISQSVNQSINSMYYMNPCTRFGATPNVKQPQESFESIYQSVNQYNKNTKQSNDQSISQSESATPNRLNFQLTRSRFIDQLHVPISELASNQSNNQSYNNSARSFKQSTARSNNQSFNQTKNKTKHSIQRPHTADPYCRSNNQTIKQSNNQSNNQNNQTIKHFGHIESKVSTWRECSGEINRAVNQSISHSINKQFRQVDMAEVHALR